MYQLLDGKIVSDIIKSQIKAEIEIIKSKYNKNPKLAVILVGDNPASQTYVKNKINACKKYGIDSICLFFESNISQKDLICEIDKLNNDLTVNGILVQLPLPLHINEFKIIEEILPQKDVDGFHPLNVGKLWIGEENGFYPCTPYGILELISYYNIQTSGKNVVIIGRSNIVGKPLASLLLRKNYNATVTICHSYTKDIINYTKSADILISAIGKPCFIKKNMVKENSIIIDVGINRIQCKDNEKGYKICGDIDFDNVKKVVSWITPVPGGVGPMTVAMLLKNTLTAFKNQNNINID